MIGSRAGCVKDACGAGYAGRAPARSRTRPPARRTRQLSGGREQTPAHPKSGQSRPEAFSNECLRSPADTGKGGKAPIQAGQRWHVERTNSWHNAFGRLQRCYERREEVIDAFFDLADTIITVRSLIRQAWTTYRWDDRPAH